MDLVKLQLYCVYFSPASMKPMLKKHNYAITQILAHLKKVSHRLHYLIRMQLKISKKGKLIILHMKTNKLFFNKSHPNKK